MNQRSYYWIGLVALWLTTGLGCGDDATSEAPDPFPDLSEAQSLEYQSDALAVGFHHGSTVRLTPGESPDGALEQTRGVIDHAFLHVSAFDIYATTYGEYLYYRAPNGVSANGPDYFRSNPKAAQFEPRAADLFDEVESAMAESGDDFASYSVVLDLWNSRTTWYVPWDGGSNRMPGEFGLYRDDMRESLIEQISAVAAAHQPRYFIVGNEMDRLLDEEASTYSPAEFSNFLLFYQEAAAAIHDASPETKVGAGINWDRFVSNVAPRYVAEIEGDESSQPSQNAEIDAGFKAVLLPLLAASDILSLKSYPLLDEANSEAYQFLRRLNELYEVTKPLVWYSIGTPVTSRSGYNQQGVYLERFAEWNAGLAPEMVAWNSLINIDGSDVGSGEISGQCSGLTGTANDFEIPLEHCFDGLFSSSLQPKAAFDVLKESVK